MDFLGRSALRPVPPTTGIILPAYSIQNPKVIPAYYLQTAWSLAKLTAQLSE